jgi:hypothetical protein
MQYLRVYHVKVRMSGMRGLPCDIQESLLIPLLGVVVTQKQIPQLYVLVAISSGVKIGQNTLMLRAAMKTEHTPRQAMECFADVRFDAYLPMSSLEQAGI